MAKYDPLTITLRSMVSSGLRTIEMSFLEVEAVVGRLPPSSRAMRQWWANGSLTQANAWRAAGLHVAWVSLDHERVRFEPGLVGGRQGRRAAPSGTVSAPPEPRTEGTTPRPTRDTLRVSAPLAMSVRLQWRDVGLVTLDGSGRPVFGAVPSLPGLYRLVLHSAPDHQNDQVYVGESANLKRRLTSNYRSPGPTQSTSLRINALLRRHLGGRGVVDLALATEATVTPEGEEPAELDLAVRASRLLIENAALVLLQLAGDAEVVNLP